jgi:WD40 repeat protein
MQQRDRPNSSSINRTPTFVQTWAPYYDAEPNSIPAYPKFERYSMGPSTGVTASGIRFNKDGRKFLVSYQNDQIYSFPTCAANIDGEGPLQVFGGHLNHRTFLKGVDYFGPNDEYVVSGSDSGHIFIWDERGGYLNENENLDYSSKLVALLKAGKLIGYFKIEL